MIEVMGRLELGDISLYNADCFDILPKITSNSIDLVLADLPYGTTACKWDSVLPLDKLWVEYERVTKENAAIVLTAAQPFTWRLCASNPEWFRYELIWEKPNGTNPMLVKQQPFRVHENILVFYKKQPTYNPQMMTGAVYSGFEDMSNYDQHTLYAEKITQKTIGEVYGDGTISRHKQNDGTRYPRSVQKFAQDRSGHPTKKPVELFRWLIRTYSNPGELVLDNTLGEGTTAVAALLEERRCIGIELEKKYFDRAVQDIRGLSNVSNR